MMPVQFISSMHSSISQRRRSAEKRTLQNIHLCNIWCRYWFADDPSSRAAGCYHINMTIYITHNYMTTITISDDGLQSWATWATCSIAFLLTQFTLNFLGAARTWLWNSIMLTSNIAHIVQKLTAWTTCRLCVQLCTHCEPTLTIQKIMSIESSSHY